eukprot:CAMPEP_0171918434 /NCGR_PEP_ID=MMETSP0993-20121228/17153_1 /TAXON_ID=483369 /ORGANISM="non described non described, Strain CCMP2098" /LENGTH=287 /DNA_ID=CAMNT_0012554761 /DNA_START=1 /DNA_END=865 /DNA_ORIENTATION=-
MHAASLRHAIFRTWLMGVHDHHQRGPRSGTAPELQDANGLAAQLVRVPPAPRVLPLLGVGYGVLTTILFSPLVLDLAGPAGAWCWSNDKTWSEVMYGGLWVGFCVIIGCSIWIYRMIQLAEQALLLRITSGDADARDVGRKRQSWALVRRLMLLPLSYILLHVPGTIRRNADRMGSPQFDSPAMAYLQGICDPSQGAVNFLLFGVLDRSLHKEMRELWRRKWPNSALSEKEFTAAVKSSDRRSKKRPSSARKSEYEVSDSDSDDDDDDDDDDESGKWVEMTKTGTNV